MGESDSHFSVLRRLCQSVLPKAGVSERRFESLDLTDDNLGLLRAIF
jgi:hypothetical protein